MFFLTTRNQKLTTTGLDWGPVERVVYALKKKHLKLVDVHARYISMSAQRQLCWYSYEKTKTVSLRVIFTCSFYIKGTKRKNINKYISACVFSKMLICSVTVQNKYIIKINKTTSVISSSPILLRNSFHVLNIFRSVLNSIENYQTHGEVSL